MERQRFEVLISCLPFGTQFNDIVCRSARAQVEREKWGFIEPFVKAFNLHHQETVTASHILCVGEFISRWYGRGGSWIDVECPHCGNGAKVRKRNGDTVFSMR